MALWIRYTDGWTQRYDFALCYSRLKWVSFHQGSHCLRTSLHYQGRECIYIQRPFQGQEDLFPFTNKSVLWRYMTMSKKIHKDQSDNWEKQVSFRREANAAALIDGALLRQTFRNREPLFDLLWQVQTFLAESWCYFFGLLAVE